MGTAEAKLAINPFLESLVFQKGCSGGSQNEAQGPQTAGSPRELIRLQIPGPHPTGPQSLGLDPEICLFHKPSGDSDLPPKYAASCVFDQIPQKQALKGKGGLLMQGFRRKVLPRKVHRKWGSRRERKEPGKGVGSEEVLQMWGLQPDPTRAPESSKGLQPPQVFQGSTS